MVQLKISQLMMAAGVAAAALVGFGGTADAAPSAGSAALACVNGDGVIALTVTDSATDGGAQGVACDAPACAEGVLTTVVDDSGVQHEACVASAAAVPPAPAAKAMLAPPIQSAPTQPVAADNAPTLPRTGTGTDGLVIAALLVGSGSVASLLSRRKS
jgi:LPXTG-motif cell wall-anchored protein